MSQTWPGRCPQWLVVPAALLFFYLALNSLVGDSPTMDEQNHLARGLAFLRTGDPRLSVEHPPLVNALSALPLLTVPGIRLPTDHPSWQQPEGWYAFAEQLLWVYNHDVTRMVFLARLPIVFLGLGLALAGYHFARQLWGRPSAAFVFLWLLFDPNLLAHTRYTTTDLGGAAFLLLAVFSLWRLWQVEGWPWRRWLALTVSLGLAFSSKLSNLSFASVFVVLAVLPLYSVGWGWRPAGRRLLQLALAGLASLLVVWAVFAFQWGPFTFRAEPFIGLNGRSGPMPTFWAGIEQIWRLSDGGRPSFLLGQFSTTGFVGYFPVAFLVKTPLPHLLLIPIAAFFLLKNRHARGRAVFLLLPAAFYFGLSMQSSLNIGYRHLLPILPFLFLLVGGLAGGKSQVAGGRWQGASGKSQVAGGKSQVAGGKSQVAGGKWQIARFTFHVSRFTFHASRFTFHVSHLALFASTASILVSDLLIHPHYLSYFNVAAGGPENGYNILVDSNVDWGQDLLRLRDWLVTNQVKEEIKLSWFGTADPAYYGIQYQPLPGLPRHFDLWWNAPFDPAAPEPGLYAISVSNLWEVPLAEKTVFAWFRGRPPDDRVGYSILIYRVP